MRVSSAITLEALPMQRFVHDENLKRFRELVAQERDPIKREQIEKLIQEEMARKADPTKDGKRD